MRDREAVVKVVYEAAQDWTTLGEANRFLTVLLGLVAAGELDRQAAQNISWAAMRYNGGDVSLDHLRAVIEESFPIDD